MLRVGLTGELGSGKSTVAQMLAQRGAIVLSSDEMGRALMQPGQPAFITILRRFGLSILSPDGTLNRSALAKLAFDPQHPRIEELNAIIHPAVLAAQAERIAELTRTHPHAIVVIESALIFSTKHAPGRGWADRFDCIVLVTAPDELKIDRFIQRSASGVINKSALRDEARRRIEAQRATIPADIRTFTIQNHGSLADLATKIGALWSDLAALEKTR